MSRQDFEAERTILNDFKNISSQIGRKVRIELEIISSVNCSLCVLDPVSRTSTNIKCTGCGGTGYVNSSKRVIVNGWIASQADKFDKSEPGITISNTSNVYFDRKTYYLFKNWLKRKYRIRIDNEIYEIISQQDAGTFRVDFVLFTCQKVEGL
jgi:ribosomal protein L37AE/L43A